MFKARASSLSSVIANVCLGCSTMGLGVGYILAGYWLVLPVFVGMFILWIYLKNRSVFWSASILLFANVFLAAVGIAMGLSLPLMTLGCTASLAYWDLADFRQSIPGRSLTSPELSLEKHHLQSLAAAICTGLMIVLISFSFNLRLPFSITVILALLSMGCLTYGLRYLLRGQ